jgi:hypothetical protein
LGVSFGWAGIQRLADNRFRRLKNMIRACVVWGVGAIVLLGGSCMKPKEATQSRPALDEGPRDGGLPANHGPQDFVAIRIKTSRITGGRRIPVFERVLRIPLPRDVPPERIREEPSSVPVFSIDCEVEDFSIRSLSVDQKQFIRGLTGGWIMAYGINRSGDDPCHYFIMLGSQAVHDVRASDEAELFHEVEGWFCSELGARFTKFWRGALSEEEDADKNKNADPQ